MNIVLQDIGKHHEGLMEENAKKKIRNTFENSQINSLYLDNFFY